MNTTRLELHKLTAQKLKLNNLLARNAEKISSLAMVQFEHIQNTSNDIEFIKKSIRELNKLVKAGV